MCFGYLFAEQKYWAKDIIFLVTEHEQLGMQAWLDAYHGVTSGQDGILMAGDLSGRAGSIQAAINLEFHAMKITSIDVKVNVQYRFYLICQAFNVAIIITCYYSFLFSDRRIEWSATQFRSL